MLNCSCDCLYYKALVKSKKKSFSTCNTLRRLYIHSHTRQTAGRSRFLSSILPEADFRLPEICKTPSAASKQQVINISCQQYTGATVPQSRHRLNQGTSHRIYAESVRVEQCGRAPTTTRLALQAWAARPHRGCVGGRCNAYLEHRFAAPSALLPHPCFARCAPCPAIAAPLAVEYLRQRRGLHLFH